MNYADIKVCDIANGPGVRVSLFVCGCRNGCEGCFNPDQQSFDAGTPFTRDTWALIEDHMRPCFVEGLTLLGGEPFEPENQRDLLPFLRHVRESVPGKTIWAYSGFTWDEMMGGSRASMPETPEILSLIDVLVDGRFVMDAKDISLRFRGSANQRVIDVKKSLETGEAVIWHDDRVFETHDW